MVPGDSLSPLVRQGQEHLEQLQAHRNYITKMMVDAAAVQVNPMIMCSNTLPPPTNIKPGQAMHVNNALSGIQSAVSSNVPRTLKIMLKQQFRNMIPDVVWDNVYRTDETHVTAEDCELIKFTFFNDQTITLKAYILPRTTTDELTIEVLCDDFEEWCATAIMKCDAGEDVWERPKPDSGVGAQRTATQVRAQQLQAQQSMQALVGGAFSGSGEVPGLQAGFGQGLAQGLAASGLGPFGSTK